MEMSKTLCASLTNVIVQNLDKTLVPYLRDVKGITLTKEELKQALDYTPGKTTTPIAKEDLGQCHFTYKRNQNGHVPGERCSGMGKITPMGCFCSVHKRLTGKLIVTGLIPQPAAYQQHQSPQHYQFQQNYQSPQNMMPQYTVPQNMTPQYPIQQYSAPQNTAPQYVGQQNTTPQYVENTQEGVQYTETPQYVEGVQYTETPQYVEGVQYTEAPQYMEGTEAQYVDGAQYIELPQHQESGFETPNNPQQTQEINSQ